MGASAEAFKVADAAITVGHQARSFEDSMAARNQPDIGSWTPTRLDG